MPVDIILRLCLTAAGLTALPCSAEETQRTVDQYKCKDVMRETGANREVAIAFLHGYLLGTSGGQKFDVQMLAKQTNAFLERCLDNPNEDAVASMKKVKDDGIRATNP